MLLKVYMEADLKIVYGRALKYATEKHKGHFREDGSPFISHPIAVADRVSTLEEKIVALVHDIFEETKTPFSELFDLGFPTRLVRAVETLTRIPDESYEDYINRVLTNQLAIIVKLSDIDHNLETINGTKLTPTKQMKRQKKYRYYRSILISHLK